MTSEGPVNMSKLLHTSWNLVCRWPRLLLKIERIEVRNSSEATWECKASWEAEISLCFSWDFLYRLHHIVITKRRLLKTSNLPRYQLSLGKKKYTLVAFWTIGLYKESERKLLVRMNFTRIFLDEHFLWSTNHPLICNHNSLLNHTKIFSAWHYPYSLANRSFQICSCRALYKVADSDNNCKVLNVQ